MFDALVLGVDPGVAATGLAVVARSGPEVVWADTVRTPPRLAEPDRLRRVHAAVRAAIAEHRPGAVALESVRWNRNVSSAMGVARASGVVLLAAAEAGVPVEEYEPLEVKMAVTGSGRADKQQVRRALVRAHGLAGVPEGADAVDAVAVALCHLTRSRLRGAAAR